MAGIYLSEAEKTFIIHGIKVRGYLAISLVNAVYVNYFDFRKISGTMVGLGRTTGRWS